MVGISSTPTAGLISSPGLGSGLNVNDLVTKLVAAERKPAQSQIDNQRTIVNAQTTAVGSLKSLLSSLQGSLKSLADGSAFSKYTASASNKDLFTASAGSGAAPGSYSVELVQMAAAQKLASAGYAADAAVGTGTLTLSVGTTSLDISIDSSNNTLAGIRDAINGAAGNPGVRAAILHTDDGDHLVFTATQTGADHAFSISAAGGDGGLAALTWDTATASGGLSQQTAATDAIVKIDGFETHSANNVFDKVIAGVSINVASLGNEPGKIETLTVSRDDAATQNLVNSFVDAYNKFVAGADQLASYDKTSNTSGPLLGDATLRGIRMQLASVLSSTGGSNATGLRALGEVGVSLQADGTLKFDAEKFSTAVSADSGQVARLFQGAEGFGGKLNGLLDGYLKTGGLLDARNSSLDARSKRLDDQQDRLDTRMQAVQDRYLQQFTALDVTMSQMNQTSSFLSSQLDMLASMYKPDKK